MRKVLFLLVILNIVFVSCRKAPKAASECHFTNIKEDNFTIVSNDDSPERTFNVFCKKINSHEQTHFKSFCISHTCHTY